MLGGQEQPNTVNPNNPGVERLDRAERGREGSVKIPAGKLPALGLDFCWLYSLFLSPDKDEFDVMFSSTARWTQLHGEALHRRCYIVEQCAAKVELWHFVEGWGRVLHSCG